MRSYLDWNATAPLRDEARSAMVAAMGLVGNPSSVHAEGRAATAVVENARAQVAEAVGAMASDIVFTSGATEAAALALAGRELVGSGVEHDAVRAWVSEELPLDDQGGVIVTDPGASTLQAANSETGILQDLPQGLAVSDMTQAFGKVPLAFDWSGVEMGLISAHKVGGPKGIGALILRRGLDVDPRIKGGGQEMGRRSGTENLIGIAGFGGACVAAIRDIENGAWEKVRELRNILEMALDLSGKGTILVGKGANRLPNTSCVIADGWKGESQVMQMDLKGFAISAGSACSSGKVKASSVLRAMGYDERQAASAIRISIGPTTKRDDVLRFADAWNASLKKHRARAA